jgi:hypothetical protein
MCILDRVLISPDWELIYGNATCETLTRVGSNHCPLKVDTEDEMLKQSKQFRFEVAWLTQEGFREKLKEKWPVRGGLEIQDYCQIRKFYRGWGANLSRKKRGSEAKN